MVHGRSKVLITLALLVTVLITSSLVLHYKHRVHVLTFAANQYGKSTYWLPYSIEIQDHICVFLKQGGVFCTNWTEICFKSFSPSLADQSHSITLDCNLSVVKAAGSPATCCCGHDSLLNEAQSQGAANGG